MTALRPSLSIRPCRVCHMTLPSAVLHFRSPSAAVVQCASTSAELKMSVLAVSLCLLALWPLSLAEPLKFYDCGSPDGKIVIVDVSPCPTQPCPLKKGELYNINITFSSAVDTQNTTALVHGILAGVHIPFPIPEADGCKSGISCPIMHGTSYTYITSLPIKSMYPSLKLVVEWELRDDNNKDIFCWQIPVVITD